MAKSIPYHVPERAPEDGARDELDRLTRNLHDQGVLRLVNNLLESSPDVAERLLNGLNRPESLNGLQNLCLLATALGRVPPERLDRLIEALAAGAAESEAGLSAEPEPAPGLFGSLRLLQDRGLWAGVSPMLSGVRAFARAMRAPLQKPAERRFRQRQKP
ncbi:DUF1641 domain-containing protein [Marinobacter sp. C2H3]|uniref:DUF1641 domain-containing protein n=1 Tax=Marinobacter sp. C2H3 TaxID=3119003 RepID=UPI00300F52A2